MSLTFREGAYDVAIVAGPRAHPWPSCGARALSTLCAQMGLTVGLVGGEDWRAHGLLPLPGTGGLVLASDLQNRVHRIRARAVVKFSPTSEIPDYFPGVESEGVLPLSTALTLFKTSTLRLGPSIVILGNSNRALKLGSDLLEKGMIGGATEVSLIETSPVTGWEVERRRFEMLGGKIIKAKPVRLSRKSPLLWEFRVEDERGVRILETARVISAGPFSEIAAIREHPPGSLLFEMDQTALAPREEDFEGWVLEEERARLLAVRIVKSLVQDLSDRKDELERIQKKAKNRLKALARYQTAQHRFTYQGKFLSRESLSELKKSNVVPHAAYKVRPVASVECFEDIGCNLCEKACPESAIKWNREGALESKPERVVSESDCTACGICLSACPSQSIVLLKENESTQKVQFTMVSEGSQPWKVGEFTTLLNRKGEALGTGRVSGVLDAGGLADTPIQDGQKKAQWVQVEAPSTFFWEARGIKRTKLQNSETEAKQYVQSLNEDTTTDRVTLNLDGGRRLMREGAPLSVVFFEGGTGRYEDRLLCADGSCGMCVVEVDGVKKFGCQTETRKGMTVKRPAESHPQKPGDLCPCLGISESEVISRITQGKLKTPEAVVAATHIGEGKCHGQNCMAPFKRILHRAGIDVEQWIDWRFPWREWPIQFD